VITGLCFSCGRLLKHGGNAKRPFRGNEFDGISSAFRSRVVISHILPSLHKSDLRAAPRRRREMHSLGDPARLRRSHALEIRGEQLKVLVFQ
jgi:hypothetical protein